MLFSYGVHTKGWLKPEEETKNPLPKKKEPAKKEIIETVAAVEEEMPINKKIKDIDVSDIDSIVFQVENQFPVLIKTQNLRKIVVLIVNHTKKTKFEPGELTGIYDQVIKNYKSSLSQIDFDMLKSTVKDFIISG
jgi:hypothetical protein